jgi:hypothetical protein
MKYLLRLWEIDEENPLRDILGQRWKKGTQLNGNGNVGHCWDICETGRKNSKNIQIRINKVCVDIERWDTIM